MSTTKDTHSTTMNSTMLSAYKFRFIDKAYMKVNDKVPNHVKCAITGLLLSPGIYTPSERLSR